MKIAVVGGGPAGLYFSLLTKKANPSWDIVVYERNKPEDTFGFGVVFSDETLSGFLDYDQGSYADIVGNFAYWDNIDTYYKDKKVTSEGHGFCGMSRKKLLSIFQKHCLAAGVKIEFETDITDLAQFSDADVILASDGINSFIRDQYAEHFKPNLDWRKNKFVWLGSTLPLDAFAFIFRESQHGLFRVHAYQFDADVSTFIVECTEETWLKAGLDTATEEQTRDYVAELYKDDLHGHELLLNRSLWRTFPTVSNENWVYENIVLLGDALHTAHFSIGSGTKLAMEDAIALYEAFQANGTDVKAALVAYEGDRKEEVARLQKTATTSLKWFEDTERYMDMDAIQFTFSMLSRSKRITYENLGRRDPKFIKQVDEFVVAEARKQSGVNVPDGTPPMFTPFKLADKIIPNRVVVSPMCQYSATDGTPNDWHMVHLGSRAIGGAGMMWTESTGVSAPGRISPGCTGIYNDEHVAAWKRIVDFVHANSSTVFGIQLSHAGRKSATCIPWEGGYDQPLPEDQAWPIVAASPIPYLEHSQVPKEIDRAEMDVVRDDFVQAAKNAETAGFDMLEVHFAHGYLLGSFISPVTNIRTDEYGGDLAARMKYPLEVLVGVRAVWPKAKPLSVRISAMDWVEGGTNGDDAVEMARMLKDHGVDVVDVSTGQTTTGEDIEFGRMFQTPYAERIRIEAGIPTIAVGAITSGDQVNTIVAAGRSDFCALARPHLAQPYQTLHDAAHYGFEDQPWPVQYMGGKGQLAGLSAKDNLELAELRDAAKPPRPEDLLTAAE
jgi:anthraniloyl-CoA monooxygenase